MNIAMLGLGKMGANMTERLLRGGHHVVVSDLNEAAVKKAVSIGAEGSEPLTDLVARLDAPRVVWVMVPAGKPTESVIHTLADLLSEGDTIIDGGNSYYKDSMRRGAALKEKGSVVRSWLLDLTANALAENPALEGIAAFVPDSGEGRWTVAEAIELHCSIPVITLAFQRRFRSREESPFGDKLLAAMRNQFGGHAIKRES